MIASQTATAASTMPRSFRSRLLAALQKRQVLLPLESGPRATRALDGLRAVAALSVLSYHLLLRLHVKGTQLGTTTYNIWHYLATGVDLFFVLSGFLLFLPYARAMLTGKPLPSASRFYQRRALRILPAYWVCLVILAVLPTAAHRVPLSFGDIATHLLMIHDAFPDYNRDLNGPFWTLAVEAQFYLLLPLLAWAMARVIGRSPASSRWRLVILVGCLMTLIAAAVVLRKVDGVVTGQVTSYAPDGPSTSTFALLFVLLTYGMQGKFLEVFALGMLCSVLYVVTVEEQALPRTTVRWLGRGAFVAALALIVLVAIPHSGLSEVTFIPGWTRGWIFSLFPLVMGGGYGLLVLGALWGGSFLRALFEFAPLRFIGLISYSLYLWHLPVIDTKLPLFSQLPLKVDLAAAFVVAYVSYQLIERPFLQWRRAARKSASTGASSDAPLQPDMEFVASRPSAR